jgi:aryl-alcohol dehydrogenase-like predicted oxidoreductase
MQFKRLGSSGLLVSELALGSMVFGEEGARSTSSAEAEKIIGAYLDAGGNHIDTADVYAGGRSEVILGEALRGRREDVVLATKVRFGTGPGVHDVGLSRKHIIAGVEASLKRLQTDYIDLLYMHCWDPLTPIHESLRAFDDLVSQGKVRYIGVSNFKAWQLMKALAVSDANGFSRFISAQYQYSLVSRDIESEFIDLLETEGIGLVPWSPLAGGFLSGKYTRDRRPTPDEGRLGSQPDGDEEAWVRRQDERSWEIDRAVREVAESLSNTPAAVALAWVIARPSVASTVIGVRTLEQLESNLAATSLHLPDDVMALLTAASRMDARYPYRFIDSYGRRPLGTIGR